MKIAIIGTGITGNAAAWALSQDHEIAVYEAAPYVGGHSNTVDVDHGGTPIAVDTGFIVYNERNYPNLTALFDLLRVETEASDMSFSVHRHDGKLEYAGSGLGSLFAQKRNMANPRFWRMLSDIMRFNKQIAGDLKAGRLGETSLGDYLSENGFSHSFQRDYLLPMGAAIWSATLSDMRQFPAASFARFFDNHGLIRLKDRPAWRTVTGGSRRYVARLTTAFRDRIRLNAAVTAVRTLPSGQVEVSDVTGGVDRYDHVVIATHSDQALAMRPDATAAERDLLGAVRYQENIAILHRDPALMPRRRQTWSSWNYRIEPNAIDGDRVAVTYWMNRLQNIDPAFPLFVTLNPVTQPDAAKVFRTFTYQHPIFDGPAVAAQHRLREIQGKHGIWYAGAWCGFGFHEDGLSAGLWVAEQLGFVAPWREVDQPWTRIAAE